MSIELATNSSATIVMRDNSQISITSMGGRASYVVTPTSGAAQSRAFGPGNETAVIGPFDEGATLVITNLSASLSYRYIGGNIPTMSDDGTSLVSGDETYPILTVGQEAEKLQGGQPVGITKYVTRVGRMFRDFSAGILGTVSAAASTVTDYTGYDGSNIALSVQSKTGLPSMTKIVITNDANQQFEITSANMGSVTTSGLIGLWIYVDLAGKVGGSSARYLMDISNQNALYSTYIRAQVSAPNQLRHGWNFIVYKQLTTAALTPASLDHFSGLTVTKFSTGANGDMLQSPLTYMQLTFVNMNGCTVYLDSLWTDFAAQPQVVLGTDQATVDCVDYALPIFQNYGWKGYSASTFRVWSSGSKVIADWNTPAGGTEYLETLYAAGWDAVNHSTNHIGPATLTAPEIRYEVQASRSWLLTRKGVRGSEFYASPQSSTSILSERVIAEAGFLLQRHGLNGKPNIQITQFGLDNANSVGSIDMSNASVGFQKYSLIKAYIDTCVSYGASVFLFWHGITTLGDSGSGEDFTGNDLQITKSAFEKTCAYIRSLETASTVAVSDGITGFYYGVQQ